MLRPGITTSHVPSKMADFALNWQKMSTRSTQLDVSVFSRQTPDPATHSTEPVTSESADT
jgi:hypothetical protein